MPRGGKRSKQYGTRKEREYIQLLLDDGYVEIIRAGASRSHHREGDGVFDVIARWDGSELQHTLWVQIKAGNKEYIQRCCKNWNPPPMPPYHVTRLAFFVRGGRHWYEQDGDGEARRRG